jgi:hypothetical protein
VGVEVEEAEVFEEVVWVEVFQEADFEVAVLHLELGGVRVEFPLGGLDQQE